MAREKRSGGAQEKDKTKKMLQGSKLRNPLIKRSLVFHHALTAELKSSAHHIPRRSKLVAKHAQLSLSGRILKKYRLLHRVHEFGLTYKTLREKMQKQRKPSFLQRISRSVHMFLENNSRVTTDKQDTITRNKVKRQRMILTNTMQNLHGVFLQQNPNIKLSYSSFCALRPFHITPIRASDRKTCLCQYHENAMLMLEVLKSFNAVATSNLEESFKLICCSPASESCLLRACSRCLNKCSSLSPEKGTTPVKWSQWKRVEEQTEVGTHFHTKLQEYTGTLSELMCLYQDKV